MKNIIVTVIMPTGTIKHELTAEKLEAARQSRLAAVAAGKKANAKKA